MPPRLQELGPLGRLLQLRPRRPDVVFEGLMRAFGLSDAILIVAASHGAKPPPDRPGGLNSS